MPQPSPFFIFSAVSCVLASLAFSGCGKTEPAQSALNVPPPPGAGTASGTGTAWCRRQRTRKRGLGRLFANRSLHLGDLRSG